MVGGTVKTIPSKVIQTQMLSRVLCLQLLWRTLRCPGIERDSFCLTGPSLLSRATRPGRWREVAGIRRAQRQGRARSERERGQETKPAAKTKNSQDAL